MKELIVAGAKVYPVMSNYAYKICQENDYIGKIEELTNNKVVCTLNEAEMLSNKINSDIFIIAPTSGNTIAKLANSITDTPITLAVKTHLKNKKPLLIFIYTNDALSTNACNIGVLLNRKNVFFVPFRQSNPITKPYSVSSDPEYIFKAAEYALQNEQIEPLLL